jgi:hypothetical protein
MRKPVEIEDIEDMRRRQGIDDAELRERVRQLRAGDLVKLTLHSGTRPSAGQTVRVRITSVRGATFRGKLVDGPAAAGLSGLTVGSPIVFSAAHIHSASKREPHPGGGRRRHGEGWRAGGSTAVPAPGEAAKPVVSGARTRLEGSTVTTGATRGPTRPRTTLRRSSSMLSSYSVACPHEGCGWTGSLVPSQVEGGGGAEIASGQAAWFECPRCERSWEVRIRDDRVTRTVRGGNPGEER